MRTAAAAWWPRVTGCAVTACAVAACVAPVFAESAPPALRLQLLTVKRIYVDRLTGGETAAQLRDMVISSLQQTQLFVLTEKEERADAVLRGAAEDLIFTDTFQSSESLQARAAVSGPGFSQDSNSNARTTAANRRYASVGVGQSESTRIAERKHEAMATVRLVNRDGDVIWATTKESLGAKFRGASHDVAEKITRQLLDDYERAQKAAADADTRRR